MAARTFEEIQRQIEAVASKNGGDYNDYLSVAIAILDSEFMNYDEGALEEFLKDYLHSRFKEEKDV